MSSQRGNVNRSRPQKHKNTFAFKNDLHTKGPSINVDTTHVCTRCKDIILWKIKYNKYKILKQQKTCSMCKQRNIKQNYHSICNDCADSNKKCAKCLEFFETNKLNQNTESLKVEVNRIVNNFENDTLREKLQEYILSKQLDKEDEMLQIISYIKDMKLEEIEIILNKQQKINVIKLNSDT